MNKNTIIGVVVVVLILIGAYALASNKSVKDVYVADDTMGTLTDTTSDSGMDSNAGMDQSGSGSMDTADGSDAMTDDSTVSGAQSSRAGSYEAYSSDKIAMAQTGDIVIFFHASWCPSCRALNSDIEKNVSSLPQGLVVLKADYDKETELKKKYGVTSQHTLVQVDKDGNLIKKWTGGSKVADLVAQVI
jgi:thioredoxin 1